MGGILTIIENLNVGITKREKNCLLLDLQGSLTKEKKTLINYKEDEAIKINKLKNKIISQIGHCYDYYRMINETIQYIYKSYDSESDGGQFIDSINSINDLAVKNKYNGNIKAIDNNILGEAKNTDNKETDISQFQETLKEKVTYYDPVDKIIIDGETKVLYQPNEIDLDLSSWDEKIILATRLYKNLR